MYSKEELERMVVLTRVFLIQLLRSVFDIPIIEVTFFVDFVSRQFGYFKDYNVYLQIDFVQIFKICHMLVYEYQNGSIVIYNGKIFRGEEVTIHKDENGSYTI